MLPSFAQPAHGPGPRRLSCPSRAVERSWVQRFDLSPQGGEELDVRGEMRRPRSTLSYFPLPEGFAGHAAELGAFTRRDLGRLPETPPLPGRWEFGSISYPGDQLRCIHSPILANRC